MPRGVKKVVNFETEIAQIDEKISRLQEDIKSLKEQKKKLLKNKQKADMAKVHKFIAESGLTAEEILAKLGE